MKKIEILLLLALCSVNSMAQCSKELDKEVMLILKNSSYYINKIDMNRIEKIYELCQEKPVEMLLYTAKGDRYVSNGKTEYAYHEYIQARSAYAEIRNNKPYRNTFFSLEKKIERYMPKMADVITRGITTETTTRGAKLTTEYRIENLPLNFQSNSYVVDKEGVNKEQVGEIYTVLSSAKYKGKRVYITGFTDTSGNPKDNEKLSERRASSLRKYLKARGLKNKISSEGKGESKPICAKGKIIHDKNYEYGCSIKEDKYRSRRVTIAIGDE